MIPFTFHFFAQKKYLKKMNQDTDEDSNIFLFLR